MQQIVDGYEDDEAYEDQYEDQDEDEGEGDDQLANEVAGLVTDGHQAQMQLQQELADAEAADQYGQEL